MSPTTRRSSTIKVRHIAAFSRDGRGGNPAGVAVCDALPEAAEMMATAKRVGYSETAFLAPHRDGWRVRYFAPETEVPFCGHATIASGAVLAERDGPGAFRLYLNDADLTIHAERAADGSFTATLHSPATASAPADDALVDRVLATFGFGRDAAHAEFPIRVASAGARHLVVVLRERASLAAMAYDFDALRAVMADAGLVTINLLWHEAGGRFHSRNPFPPGGVYEDPATGAAAAAFAGYLRDIGWHVARELEILQGEDMGVPSRLIVVFDDTPGARVAVTGETRDMERAADGATAVGR